MNEQQMIPSWLEPLFWDLDPKNLLLDQHYIYIVERILNFGDLRALRWLFRVYKEKTIREAVTLSRGLTLKTALCWQNYFGLREDEMRCTGMVTWLYYPNPLLEANVAVEELPNFYMSSLLDIGLMKWAAISHRGARRDFIDLYCICRRGYDLQELFFRLDQKFPGAEINHYHMVKSLSYFVDAEREAHPQMISEVNWEKVKAFFIEEQKTLLKKLL